VVTPQCAGRFQACPATGIHSSRAQAKEQVTARDHRIHTKESAAVVSDGLVLFLQKNLGNEVL
jgi:hypothetical protein